MPCDGRNSMTRAKQSSRNPNYKGEKGVITYNLAVCCSKCWTKTHLRLVWGAPRAMMQEAAVRAALWLAEQAGSTKGSL